MLCVDTNVLVNAAFADAIHHESALDVLSADDMETVAVLSVVASGFLRISTNRRAMEPALEPADAVAFLDGLLGRPNVRLVEPGPSHWRVFRQLLLELQLRDRLVPDAWIAAAAMSTGATLVSFDRDFARFPGLRWIDPAHR